VDKLLLISILLVTIILPIAAANDPDPRRGLRRTVVGFCVFMCLWVFSLLFIYPRLLAMAS
jgi:hypothetical protein